MLFHLYHQTLTFLLIVFIFLSCQTGTQKIKPYHVSDFRGLKLLKILKTQKQPKQVCFHSGRNEMYVANMNDASGRGGKVLTPGSLQIYSLPQTQLLHQEKARTAVECMVTNNVLYYSDMFRDEVVALNLNNRKVTFRMPIKSNKEKNYSTSHFLYMPKIIIAGPKKNQLTISKWLAGISILDSKNGTFIKRIPKFCEHPRGLLYNQNGNLIVMCYGVPDGLGQILLLDPKRNFKIIQKKVTYGSPRHIVASSRGKALISDLGKGRILEIDTNTLKTLRTLTVGGQPNSIALDPDLNHLYVSQRKSNSLSIVSLSTWKVIKKYKTQSYPTGLAVSQDGQYVAVTNFHDSSLSLFQVIRD